MRLCYLADAGSIHTQRWVKYFADNGHEVHLISLRSFDSNEIKNVKLHLLGKLPQLRIMSFVASLVANTLKVKKLLREINPDILHVHYINDIALLGATSGFHPLVATAWGSDVLVAPRRSKVVTWLVKYVLKKADLVTCSGEHMKKPLIDLGADPQKIRVIYHGVDTQKFKPRQGNEALRDQLGIFDSPVVISLRSLEPIYDIESLLTSIPIVLKEIPETIFVIAGSGSREASLKELAKSLNVSANVRFVGRVPHAELPGYLGLADVYVSTALSDGLACSTMEAMACGLPVIITDFGDNSRWVQDGVNGYIIPLRSPQSLASRIVQLLHDEETRKRFGQINRQIIEERNNWQKEMGRMEKLYEELIERRRIAGEC